MTDWQSFYQTVYGQPMPGAETPRQRPGAPSPQQITQRFSLDRDNQDFRNRVYGQNPDRPFRERLERMGSGIPEDFSNAAMAAANAAGAIPRAVARDPFYLPREALGVVAENPFPYHRWATDHSRRAWNEGSPLESLGWQAMRIPGAAADILMNAGIGRFMQNGMTRAAAGTPHSAQPVLRQLMPISQEARGAAIPAQFDYGFGTLALPDPTPRR